jgi:hypothetical protein
MKKNNERKNKRKEKKCKENDSSFNLSKKIKLDHVDLELDKDKIREQIKENIKDDTFVHWTKDMDMESKLSLSMLLIQLNYMRTPTRKGNFASGDDCMVFVSRIVLSDLIKYMNFVKPTYWEYKVASCHFPYTGETYKHVEWEFDEDNVYKFIYAFEYFKPSLDILWLFDRFNPTHRIRIDYPQAKFGCFFDSGKEATEEFNEWTKKTFESGVAGSYYLTTKIGLLPGKKRISKFKLIYTENLSELIPGGTLKLSFGYDVYKNGELEKKTIGEEVKEKTLTMEEKKQFLLEQGFDEKDLEDTDNIILLYDQKDD